MQQVHCTRVVKPAGEVPWPIERSHQASCVLANPLTGHKNTHILSVGGEKNSWDKQSKCTGETLSDVWIGEYSKDRKTTWKQVRTPCTIYNTINNTHYCRSLFLSPN